jgi:hypothetical protein
MKNLASAEKILIFSGLLFLSSVIYIASGGDLLLNYLAKGFYIFGTLVLIFKK